MSDRDVSKMTPEQAYEFGWEDGLQDAFDDPNLLAVVLGSAGGRKGGPARAASLSPQRRSEIARKAAQTRWGRR
jgi:hypothetical protein